MRLGADSSAKAVVFQSARRRIFVVRAEANLLKDIVLKDIVLRGGFARSSENAGPASLAERISKRLRANSHFSPPARLLTVISAAARKMTAWIAWRSTENQKKNVGSVGLSPLSNRQQQLAMSA